MISSTIDQLQSSTISYFIFHGLSFPVFEVVFLYYWDSIQPLKPSPPLYLNAAYRKG